MVEESATVEHDVTGTGSLPTPPVTGDIAVDDAVAGLTDLAAVPLAEHPAVYESVHRTLTDRLADVEG